MVVSTHLKNMLVKLDHVPKFRDENDKYMSCHHLGSKKSSNDDDFWGDALNKKNHREMSFVSPNQKKQVTVMDTLCGHSPNNFQTSVSVRCEELRVGKR